MITIKEIAKRCNVSPSTVSNILNGRSNVGDRTRQAVLNCIEETGYQPNYFAQSMRKQSNRMIIIITEDLTNFGTNPVVETIMRYCSDNNYRTILMNLGIYKKLQNSWYNEPEQLKAELRPFIQEALSIKANGIIYVTGHCRIIDCFPPKFPIPTLIAYGISKDKKYPSVIIDDEKGGYDTAKYLIAKGHKKIGVVAGAADNLHTQQRMLGYQQALNEAGVSFKQSWLFYGNWRRISGYQGAMYLADKGVTAVFCMNDEMAAGIYDYFYEHNITIGRDISVIGFDNMDLSDYLRPRMTTSEILLSEIGRRSAEIMLQILEKKIDRNDCSKIFKVPCQIIERDSVVSLE